VSVQPSVPVPPPGPARVTPPDLAAMKRAGRPIVMVTAYDHPSARIAEDAGVDIVFVGDSAAMVVLGMDSTVPIGLDEMVMLGAAARRGCRRALLLVDMPFMSYQVSDEDALRSAGRLLKEAGADAVKLEGAGPALQRIAALTAAGIAVVGHLGLTPQTATALGGYRAQGRTASAAVRLLRDALATEAAGACALVLECVPAEVAERIAQRLTIPVIGIGSGTCDGQVLVWHDLLGLGEGRTPRFVRRYAELREAARDAVARYAADVRSRDFPGPQHVYEADEAALAALDEALGEAAHIG
jgi:3-methyl-2-oxobutanoate hydroxymethyltransferase